MATSEKEKMLAGELYDPGDEELLHDRTRAEAALLRFNVQGEREALRCLLGGIGADTTIRAPFFCDYGYNIEFGAKVFLNFNCVFLDVCRITVGDGCQIGPGVQIYAADHPRDPKLRRQGLENGRPVTVGPNVWIGGGAILLPGVTIGEDAVIGAGSIVTRDVAPGATVMGNPAQPRIRGDR